MPDLQAVTTDLTQDSNTFTSQSLADILFAQKFLTKQQYDDVKVKSASKGVSEDTMIESLEIVPEDKLYQAKALILGIPFVDINNVSFSPEALGKVPRAVAERFSLIPFSFDEKDKSLSIAMGNPVDLEAATFVREKTGLNIKSFAATPSDVTRVIGQQYRQELVGEVGEAIKETEDLQTIRTIDSEQIAQIIKEAPIAKIVSTILEYAVTSRASDVHIEPQEDRVRVRYRIDGILYDKLSLPKNVQDAVISRIKILSEMKIDEHRLPQDGRFNFKISNEEVDLRIAILPTAHGEKILMRLLRKTGGIPTLDELGLNGNSLQDPIEYQLSGVNQVAVNPAVGLTFATGLRAFLRQDPNIILVGEIRDKE